MIIRVKQNVWKRKIKSNIWETLPNATLYGEYENGDVICEVESLPSEYEELDVTTREFSHIRLNGAATKLEIRLMKRIHDMERNQTKHELAIERLKKVKQDKEQL